MQWALLAVALASARAVPTGLSTYLLLDSRNVVATDGPIRLALGPVRKYAGPMIRESEPWELRFDNMGPSVHYQAGRWRCWYSSFTACQHPAGHTPECCLARPSDCTAANHTVESHGDRSFALLYAESPDGLSWVKPRLGLVQFNNSAANNMVLGLNGTTGTGVQIDPTSQKLLSFGTRKGGPGDLWLGASDDGLRFNVSRFPGFQPASLDGHMNAVFDPATRKWIGYLRCSPSAGLRTQCYTESSGPDWRTASWSLPRPTGLNSSALYQPDALVGFRYAGLFLGIVNCFNPTQTAGGALRPGRANAVLAWSPDGRRWEYIRPAESLIPYLPGSGQWDCCSVFGAKQSPEQTPQFLNGADSLPLWYAGCNGRFFGPRACGLGKAEIQRHGFAGMHAPADSGGGTVEVAPSVVSTGELRVTATGRVTVGVVGDAARSAAASTVVNGTEVLVKWGGLDLDEYRGGAVALSFSVPPGGMLYAYHM